MQAQDESIHLKGPISSEPTETVGQTTRKAHDHKESKVLCFRPFSSDSKVVSWKNRREIWATQRTFSEGHIQKTKDTKLGLEEGGRIMSLDAEEEGSQGDSEP